MVGPLGAQADAGPIVEPEPAAFGLTMGRLQPLAPRETLYGVKWQNFKLVMYLQKTLSDPSLKLATPYLINLTVDPKERKPFDFPYLHSWVMVHVGKILRDYGESVAREALIPAGAPLGHVPDRRP